MFISAIQKFLLYLSLVVSAYLSFSGPISDYGVDAGIINKDSAIIAENSINSLKKDDFVDAMDFGAKGDGITDDTEAIQNAIYYASTRGKTVLLPATASHYLITEPIWMVDNTSIMGYGATLYMEPQDKINGILLSPDDFYIQNVRIEGLSFKSLNTKAGTGIYENSLTSYVDGISFYGVKNLILSDIYMENMHGGLKLGDNDRGGKNESIKVDNLNIINSRMPVYLSSADDLQMSNSTLDAAGGSDQRLHSIYINGNTSNFYFENVVFRNASGGGIHIYKESVFKKPSKNMVFNNCTIENCKVGAFIWSDAENIKVLKSTIRKCDLAFHIEGAHGITISEVDIGEHTQKYVGNKGVFFMKYCDQSEITKVEVDCSTMGGSLFELGDGINDLLVSSIYAKNMNDSGFFYATSRSIKGLVVENSAFEWNNFTKPKISFRGAGSEAVFRNNVFYNSSKEVAYLCFNFPNTHITLVNNSLKGLKENMVNR